VTSHVALLLITSSHTRHITSRHVTSRHVTSRHVTSRHVTSRHVTSRHDYSTIPPSPKLPGPHQTRAHLRHQQRRVETRRDRWGSRAVLGCRYGFLRHRDHSWRKETTETTSSLQHPEAASRSLLNVPRFTVTRHTTTVAKQLHKQEPRHLVAAAALTMPESRHREWRHCGGGTARAAIADW
jgi:hypothetical protein